MTTISLEELPPTTAEAVKLALADGKDVFITDDKKERLGKVVAVDPPADASQPAQERNLFGSMKGVVKYMADDFNDPLDDFKDYMPG